MCCPYEFSIGCRVHIIRAEDGETLDVGEVVESREGQAQEPPRVLGVKSFSLAQGHGFLFGYFPELESWRVLSNGLASPHGREFLIVPA